MGLVVDRVKGRDDVVSTDSANLSYVARYERRVRQPQPSALSARAAVSPSSEKSIPVNRLAGNA